jgi:DHA2 family multidrug resistance protein
VTLARGEVTQRLDQVTAYFQSHGVSDRIAAMHEAVVYLGAVVKRQALIMGFSDTFAVIGVLLAAAAIALLFARKAQGAGGAPAH